MKTRRPTLSCAIHSPGKDDLLTRVKAFIIIGLLTLLLAVMSIVTGCTYDNNPPVLYGPPPDMDTQGMDVFEDGFVSPDTGTDIPVVYYGPILDTITPDTPFVDIPVVEYGPPPNDMTGDIPLVEYGPYPIDMSSDVDMPAVLYGPIADVTTPDMPSVDYGPIPVDAGSSDCLAATYYGPMPCNETKDCQDLYGTGWYCDLNNTIVDSCGNTVTYPVCKEKR